ncbi:MAG: aminotransferase class V-fold PLP-dependent enzyme [Candidatus Pacebacteria bacterium]|nr:aminotransferase class V-fold PLP-dependent enzyme [Candidatus Paceibacterota bacterium]
MFNTDQIRKKFPILAGKNPPVFFDSACGSLKPSEVIKSIVEYYEKYPSCASRSLHRLSSLVDKKMSESRKTVASFIGVRQEEIIFVKNTTEAINLIARSFPFKKNDSVLISDKEHNSNFLPWKLLAAENKIKLIIFETDNGIIDLKKFEKILQKNKNIRLVSLAFTSNLDGISISASKISKIVKKYKAHLFLDAAQALPHGKIDAKNLNTDFLAFSSHKLYGPTGVGVLYIKDLAKNPINLKPFFVGGGTVDEKNNLLSGPGKFEPGLQNYSGILGLKTAIDFLNKIGMKNIKQYENELLYFLTEELKKIPRLKIINEPIKKDLETRAPIISFFIENIDSHSLAIRLDQKYNIAVRSGFFCNNFYFQNKKIKKAIRLSLSFYNTKKEIEYFISCLKKELDK